MDALDLESKVMGDSKDPAERTEGAKVGLIGGGIAGLLGSLCCIGPLVLVTVGVSGAWISNLTALQPYRWAFALAALGFLGYAWHKIYRLQPAVACEPGAACVPQTHRTNRIMFWVVSVLVLLALAFPYYVSLLY